MPEQLSALLVEDDIDDQEIFMLALAESGIDTQCVIVDNGAKALDLFLTDQNFAPDYIIMDINMPAMNGLQCLEKLNDLINLKKVRVIMLSTSSDQSVTEQAERLGARALFVKPAGFANYVSLVQKIFSN